MPCLEARPAPAVLRHYRSGEMARRLPASSWSCCAAAGPIETATLPAPSQPRRRPPAAPSPQALPNWTPAAMLTARLASCRPPLLSSALLSLRGAPAGRAAAAFHGSAQRLRGAKVAVVLSGCGVYDGTEIHEASAILVHLSRGGANVQMYAPNISQMHVIDHSKGEPAEGESRNVLVESARIARGKIADLVKLTAKDHDAVIFPGGFGAAKNLSTFAVDGKDCKVNREVERVLKDFYKSGKPIGLCCISPVLAAKVLPGTEVTVGHEEEQGGKWPYAGTAGAIKALGGKHHIREVTEAHVDTNHKVVTTPAFMCETELHHIFDGIGAMVVNVLKLTGK